MPHAAPRPAFPAAPGADPATAGVVRLVLDRGAAGAAVATAFLVAGRRGRFLATAFHNLSGGLTPGERFLRGLPPNPLSFEVHLGAVRVGRFSAYVGGRSLFRVHPDPGLRGGCDVAALDFGVLEAVAGGPLPRAFLEAPAVNEAPAVPGHGQVTDMYLPAGRGVLVLGYPGGRDYAGRPLAVGCALAAAPDPAMPYLAVSGPTSRGCSGAPAVARDFGGYLALGPTGLGRARPGLAVADQWLGLYSGRLTRLGTGGPGPATIQVGVVWTAGVVLETGEDGVPDFLP
ncbi:MAG: hypothetical protein ACP59X_03730 [Solidesulfovibrio sp. DCME]|uniref:hypothetical protein n=1 Tax=Solidesulfovibrio sp. DCME TaxID=3447380 RepID=UPI003D0C7D0E